MRQFYGHLEKCVLSAGKTMSVKFPFFGGVFWGGGGSADFIFMGARTFLKVRNCTIAANTASDFASLCGCCRFKCLLEVSDTSFRGVGPPSRAPYSVGSMVASLMHNDEKQLVARLVSVGVSALLLASSSALRNGAEAERKAGCRISEAWGPPQFQEKRSRSERAILGALGEFRGILGAALGIGNSILGIQKSILGIASHDLINTILGATLGAIPGIAANPPERFSFAPAFSERFFKNWGGPRAPENRILSANRHAPSRGQVFHWQRLNGGSQYGAKFYTPPPPHP